MKKWLGVLLILSNLVSVSYFETIKHKRDNFALCGSSIGNNYESQTRESEKSYEAAKLNRKIIFNQNNNDRLKEINQAHPEESNYLLSLNSLNIQINSSLIRISDDRIPENIFAKSIYKPS